MAAVLAITSDKIQPNNNFALIRSIKQMLLRDWNVQIVHCYREANRVADFMASYAAGLILDAIKSVILHKKL